MVSPAYSGEATHAFASDRRTRSGAVSSPVAFASSCMSEGDSPPTILIVDDSVVARAMIARAVEAEWRFAVAGAVPHVAAALASCAIGVST